jgi:N-hydroxyarylamine O-acetyltransferase
MLEISAYLDRIKYSGSTDPTAETLSALHRAHLFSVPFENLDISLGRKIVIDEAAILNKVVYIRRGGFCYELNCAFAQLLRALNYEVTLLSARVARPNGAEGPEYDHLTLRVDLDEPWLVDVGFGDSFLEPLRLQPATELIDPHGTFRLLADGERLRMEKTDADGSWSPQYSFSLQPRHLEEFAGMCHYHQTSPESSFTRQRICSLATPGGRITLAEMRLIITSQGQRKETKLVSEEERLTTLCEEFGIRL